MNEPHKPLKILRLLLTMSETSGPYNQFSLAMSDRHDITICTLFKPTVSPPPSITLFAGDRTLPGFIYVLKEALTEREYDIIHAHSVHVAFLFLVATLFYGKLARLKSWPSLSGTVYTAKTSYGNFKFRNRLMLVPVFVFFRRLVCCSEASYDSFPVFFKWLAGDRLYTIQNGMDVARMDRVIGKDSRYGQNGQFKITTVGRLIDLKNPFTILRAFQQLADPASRLLFIGEGPLAADLMTFSQTSGLGNQVEFTGLIPRDNVYKHLVTADLFISTSWIEGLPIAVLEAMACRCPVLLSDIAPHREIAGDADFIPLIQANDIAGFAQEIKRYMQMSLSERVDAGEKCRKLVQEQFSLAAMHTRYEELYYQLPYQ